MVVRRAALLVPLVVPPLVAAALVSTAAPATADATCNGLMATIVGAGTIAGTSGDDVIVGSAGADSISAGGGDDVVCDGAGADTVDLGDGEDTLSAHTARDPHDVLDGGAGLDTVAYRRARALKLTLWDTTADDGEAFEADKLLGFEHAIGGSGNDTIAGSFGEDVLDGGAGDDQISGLQAADTLLGGPGDDIFNESTVDPPGNDLIFGDAGTDEVRYTVRVEPVQIFLDESYPSGQAGEGDWIYDVENARGGSGNDIIRGSGLANHVWGGPGVDQIYDGLGADRVEGGDGCDFMSQPIGVDPGDVFLGGPGLCDYVSYQNRAVDLVLRLNTTAPVNGAAGEGDVVSGVEQTHGGSGDDLITGSGGVNGLTGGAGSDVVNGLGGSDTLLLSDGVGGNDTASCGYGGDFASIDTGDAATSCESLQAH